MYAAGYGFGNAAPNFNAGAPQQPGGQQQQHLMYNQQQQFAGMAPQAAFAPGANAQMMPGGSAGMMQNAGMPHMGANGQMPNYQQQFAGNPYGQVIPPGMTPPNFNQNNFMMAGGAMQGFPMNQSGMPQHQQQQPQPNQQQQQAQHQQQQQMLQRLAQQQGHSSMNQMSSPQRPPSAAQSTPTNALPSQQGQFQPPPPPQQQQQQQPQPQQPHQPQQPQQQPSQPQQQQHQTPTPAHAQTPTSFQPQSADGVTPSTPSFPPNPVSQQATPTGTGTEARDNQRFTLLLDINHELLYESIQIQKSQVELKKELAAEGKAAPDQKLNEEQAALQQDYVQCMRRLQTNLSYLATLADRKPDTKLPPCPAHMTPPPLNLSIKLRAPPFVPEGVDSKVDPVTDREERDADIKDLYARLQACFPGIDPTKEPAHRQGVAQPQKPTTMGNPQAAVSNPNPQNAHHAKMGSLPSANYSGMGA
ncbi:unnamed protein product [Clonostachys rhizophaga]|uniref:Uncharacterized protein n=1 Tax=Clonostachys rhizophaga TaxID=160324 RepID=A0A9N9V237_9HYPO|nr:unnamed protein product [Clonostachys rhizophaga]